MPRGHCTLPPDETGRIMDRLAGLEQIIPPDAVRQALEDSGLRQQRSCKLTHEVICWVVLAMGLLTDLPIRQVFKFARRTRAGEATPHRSSLCVARRRLGVDPLRILFDRVVRPLARPETPGASYRGLHLIGVDATVLDVPDSSANAAAFARPSGGHRGPGAFPQVRKVSLVELGTHVEFAFVARSIASGQQSMVGELLRHLTAGMLLLWDRNFFSYKTWREVTARGTEILARAKSNLILRPIRELADGSYLSEVYPSPCDRQADRDGIVVRVIRYTLDDPQRVGHGEVHVLITSLLDDEAYPARELIMLYHERWEQELVYDEQKAHQDPPRITKPAHLRSETPEGVMQELYALSLGHFVTRALMFEAAAGAGLDTDRLSFTGCLQILRCRLPECDGTTPGKLETWYRGLLWEMQRERTDDEVRRNRINPRVVKQKMKRFKKKRPEHRRPPRLKKTFAEAVVILR
jgi:Insertion element 4 transposase N-terminal/Transposase DDE domain